MVNLSYYRATSREHDPFERVVVVNNVVAVDSVSRSHLVHQAAEILQLLSQQESQRVWKEGQMVWEESQRVWSDSQKPKSGI